jgi:signal peptidase I
MRREAALGPLMLLLTMMLLVRQWVCMPVLITGKSMLPTLHGGQILLVNKLAYARKLPRRGDIVVVWTGTDLMVKRIIGLPGEEVAAHHSAFRINGKALPETYVAFHDNWDIAPGTIGPDEFAVSGDNRSQTLVAVITKARIVGKLIH